jgi:hypothetical protein
LGNLAAHLEGGIKGKRRWGYSFFVRVKIWNDFMEVIEGNLHIMNGHRRKGLNEFMIFLLY